MNQTIFSPEVLSMMDSVLWKILVIAIITSLTMIAVTIINGYFEYKRLKLLMKADPRILALEYMKTLKVFLREYGLILKNTEYRKPFYVFLKKKISDLFSLENRYKILVFLLILILILYLFNLVYR